MQLFWREHKIGFRLILENENNEQEVGMIRKTPRGFDAMAKTFGYDPGRAQKDISSFEEAKDFVESFHPWEMFVGPVDLEVETEIRPVPQG